MTPLTRREFVRKTTLATAATPLLARLAAAEKAAVPAWPAAAPGGAPVRWIDEAAPRVQPGVTWGVSWPRGQHAAGTSFTLRSAAGSDVPVQSWPLATWPDGSLKWTAHALPAGVSPGDTGELLPGEPLAPARPLQVIETAETITVDTGVIRCVLARGGRVLVREITHGDKVVARDGGLVCLLEHRGDGTRREEAFAGEIEAVAVEQAGPVRAVVKFTGKHAAGGEGGRRWLPFVVRLYFYSGGEAIRGLHSIVFDGDEQQDFIKGLGVRFHAPLRGALHDRHVRFAGEEGGLFGEAVRQLTGLRRDPGPSVRAAQLAGQATPPLAEWNQAAATRLDYIPAYDDWTLLQGNADGFDIRKRFDSRHVWLTAAQGRRAGGLVYVGTPDGGVAAGLRNFWESHPAQLDVRGARGDAAEVTLWLWAPDGPVMDLRPYHDGLGQDTYDKQYNGGLEITYEDYEPGFDSPEGVARTSEFYLWALPATPAREALADLAALVRRPPQPATTPAHLAACRVFGGMWSPVDVSTPAKAELERRLGWHFDFYRDQQEQRRWYGFWNYGDVMHTYDADRHEWRYDVGGYAWDNSELSTDIWLWLYFLRTGRADVFRFAEAMTRHTGEVDVHHIGRFAPLGSRHNVLHWGCSAKQLRISTAVNRRYYYYLTGDERVGDLMRAQNEAGHALLRIPPGRKLAAARERGDLDRPASTSPEAVGLGFGTDWGSLAGAWLTEWERTGDPAMLERLRNGMRTIGAQRHGFFSTGATFNLLTGEYSRPENPGLGISHLNAAFGLPEVAAELIELIDEPGFRQAWIDYCTLYNAPAEEQAARLNGWSFQGNLGQGHSRLTAYAAHLTGDKTLAQRAWREFFAGAAGYGPRFTAARRIVGGPAVPRPVEEAGRVSTNATAQWGLAAMQCLALAAHALPEALD
ncbi:MAG: Tat pathway signal sequence domain protein [Opitutaceae bacterium]|nr:Tat pathway signal sequence domain protein [Opitutaceae bacterium]